MSEHNIRLFVSDLDGTLLGHKAAAQHFARAWSQLPAEQRPLLCYNTGRLLPDIQQLIRDGVLVAPDYIISGVGTSIYSHGNGHVLKEFHEILEEGWNAATVAQVIGQSGLPITRQPKHYQGPYKSSWYFDDAEPGQIAALGDALEDAGLDIHVIYSSGRHLDVLPKWANKGNSLRWLLRHLDIRPDQVIVAGDSGNDSAMFTLKGMRGIVVGNAQPELRMATENADVYHAESDAICAFGVLAGLRHYGVLPDDGADADERPENPLEITLRSGGDESPSILTGEELSFIRTGYHKAIEALKKNITPMGFSACSLEDNEVLGTDENYRSVWARDGCITLIGSLPLTDQDDEIRTCQRQTLVTLLSHISPNGQVPANVRIDDQRPDYSGVGGIAAIDGAIWVIIAFAAFVQKTRDLDLLRTYFAQLDAVMRWLSAHDSNNDALLEIPEAGDWTDLFGRSYNILYDEVLWQRCNVAFGRMLQLLGDEQRAGDYLRWAVTIREQIVTRFWPTTQERAYNAAGFADQQYALGDARYLLAQITPFDYSWRCDTLGNVMAFLYDVIDKPRAAQTFRFLWGVGINEPYPIANLYPVVVAGDKDWRNYYTVNLLNLPHHYHNGGIWPFVGGMWVRFLNKLDLRELALRELYRLAELNRLGVLNEWEFNEWAHGRTGRPMGKAYQAWSASEFILACHALNVVA